MSLFYRFAALIVVLLLAGLGALGWAYWQERQAFSDPAVYRFPLPERLAAMAELVETSEHEAQALRALDGADLMVVLSDAPFDAFAPQSEREAWITALMAGYRDALGGRQAVIFVAASPGLDESHLTRADDTMESDAPVRFAIELRSGRTLVVESRDARVPAAAQGIPMVYKLVAAGAGAAALLLLLAAWFEARRMRQPQAAQVAPKAKPAAPKAKPVDLVAALERLSGATAGASFTSLITDRPKPSVNAAEFEGLLGEIMGLGPAPRLFLEISETGAPRVLIAHDASVQEPPAADRKKLDLRAVQNGWTLAWAPGASGGTVAALML